MAPKKVAYRPPMSDSESDSYDGFYFDDYGEKPRKVIEYKQNPEQDIYDAVTEGSLEKVKEQINLLGLDINRPVNNTYTLLMLACCNSHLDIVQYLLLVKGADPNKVVDSYTALELACDGKGKDGKNVEKIVKLLLDRGALINVSSKYGTTPFMMACKNGHISVVKLLIKDVSLEAVDNNGNGPLIHAIENNHPEIVEMLIKAGFNYDAPNNKGYTARDVARMHGFDDILNMFPKEKEDYLVPYSYLKYASLKDYIPQIFLKTQCPEYFPEIKSILTAYNLEKFLPALAQHNVSLEKFLSMNDEDLRAIGIELDVQRSTFKKLLLSYHLCHWKSNSAGFVKEKDNFYKILVIIGNHMMQLVTLRGSINFVKSNLKEGILGKPTEQHIEELKQSLENYKSKLLKLEQSLKYLASFSPPQNPLFIDYDEYSRKKSRRKIKKYVQYTTLFLGFSIIACLKFKNIF